MCSGMVVLAETGQTGKSKPYVSNNCSDVESQ